MSDPLSVRVHLLHGDDSFSLNRAVKELLASAGSPADVEMNTQRLDGRQASFEEIHNAANTLPFFGGARWIIVDAALTKIDKSKTEKFLKLLDNLPPDNHLVLTLDDHQKWRKDANGRWVQIWEVLSETHWLMKWAAGRAQVEIKEFPLPDEKSMDGWIAAEVKRQGGKIDPDAAREMCRHLGNETSIASQEITKLLTYVNYQRAITAKDVIELVSEEGSADVFVMLDALTEGRTQQAQSLMHTLLEQDQPEVILGAVSHRFRQLIQMREVLDERENPKVLVARKVIFNNQVDKYTSAARRYSMARLEQIYRSLLEMDIQSKTVQLDLASSLEVFAVEAGS